MVGFEGLIASVISSKAHQVRTRRLVATNISKLLKAYLMAWGREVLSLNSSLFFHLEIVLLETPYLWMSFLFESLLLLISERNRTLVNVLE